MLIEIGLHGNTVNATSTTGNIYWYPYRPIVTYPGMCETYTWTWGTSQYLTFEDKGDHFEGLLELPGYDKSSIKIEVEDADIKVSAHRERDKNDFSITATLPKNSGEVSAKFDNGELVIRVDKLNKKKVVKIE